jgi:uncharacterized iron-regulated membrane protein
MKGARLLFRRVHLVVSLTAGLWLAVTGIAGALLVFGDALDQRLHGDLYRVSGPQRVPLAKAIEAAERAGGGTALRVRLAGSRTPVHEVWIGCDDCLRVWIDPATARVNGVRSAHGTTRLFLHELHRRMLFRGPGDIAALIGGVALLVLAATGIFLGWRGGLRVRKASNYEWHRVTGLVAAPLLMIAAGTGIYFIQAGLKAKPASAVKSDANVDALLTRARSMFPASEVTWLSLGEEVVVRFRQAREDHPNGRTFVRFDARSGAVKGTVDALRLPGRQRFLDNLYPLHITGGAPHRVLLVFAGLAPATLMVTGTILWLRRTRRKGRPKRPPLVVNVSPYVYVPATDTPSKTSVGGRIDE